MQRLFKQAHLCNFKYEKKRRLSVSKNMRYLHIFHAEHLKTQNNIQRVYKKGIKSPGLSF